MQAVGIGHQAPPDPEGGAPLRPACDDAPSGPAPETYWGTLCSAVNLWSAADSLWWDSCEGDGQWLRSDTCGGKL